MEQISLEELQRRFDNLDGAISKARKEVEIAKEMTVRNIMAERGFSLHQHFNPDRVPEAYSQYDGKLGILWDVLYLVRRTFPEIYPRDITGQLFFDFEGQGLHTYEQFADMSFLQTKEREKVIIQ